MFMCFFFFNQKTSYEMRISDWSSDVCSSDLLAAEHPLRIEQHGDDPHRLLRVVAAVAQRIERGRDELELAIALVDAERAELQARPRHAQQIGRASCRERECQYV